MLAPNKDDLGNLVKIYHDLQANAERVAFIREADERRGPLDAEIVDGCSPKWHVVVTAPAHERIAVRPRIRLRRGLFF